MKCKDCYNFTYGKCVESKCLGNCEIDSQNRTVKADDDCILSVEDLICVEFDGGEREWVLARNKEEAIAYYTTMDDDLEGYDITALNDWHNIPLKVEGSQGWEETTFLENAKEDYDPATFEPYMIASTCY